MSKEMRGESSAELRGYPTNVELGEISVEGLSAARARLEELMRAVEGQGQ